MLFEGSTWSQLKDQSANNQKTDKRFPSYGISIHDYEREKLPLPGNTYIIRERSSQRAICLDDNGKVCLVPITQEDGNNIYHLRKYASYHWHCVVLLGRLGFRHAISWSYIGYDRSHHHYHHHRQHQHRSTHNSMESSLSHQLQATVPKQGHSEDFYAEFHPEGGTVLLMYHRSKQKLQMVKMQDDKTRLTLDV